MAKFNMQLSNELAGCVLMRFDEQPVRLMKLLIHSFAERSAQTKSHLPDCDHYVPKYYPQSIVRYFGISLDDDLFCAHNDLNGQIIAYAESRHTIFRTLCIILNLQAKQWNCLRLVKRVTFSVRGFFLSVLFWDIFCAEIGAHVSICHHNFESVI